MALRMWTQITLLRDIPEAIHSRYNDIDITVTWAGRWDQKQILLRTIDGYHLWQNIAGQWVLTRTT